MALQSQIQRRNNTFLAKFPFPLAFVVSWGVVFSGHFQVGKAQDFISLEQVTQREKLLAEKSSLITGAVRDALASNWGESEVANARWVKAVEVSMAEFQVIANRIDRRHLIGKYFDRFALRDEIEDFAILVSLGRHGVPSPSAACGLVSLQKNSIDTEEVEYYRNQQLLVAEIQCRRFLKSRESLKRYAHYLVWSGFLDRTSWQQYKSMAAASIGTDEYWWHARSALVLMEISGGAFDRNIEPGRIAIHFNRWLGEVSEFEVHLPDAQSLNSPFPTWSAKMPIPGVEFRAIYDRRIVGILD